ASVAQSLCGIAGYILRGNGVLCPFLFATGECRHLFFLFILCGGENF
ncbi:hypothetical protein RUMCAL_03373, partial [Ruminococcus callidus ATCC 27760]